VSDSTAIERRDHRHVAIEAILGTGDIRLMVEAAKANVAVAVEIARDRGFVTDYDVKDKHGEVIGQRPFFHLATWQLLAQSWGLTAFTDGDPKEVKPGTWQASAVAQIIEDGRIVGRAVALCARSEPGKKYKGDHDLAATAQSRAQRNAIRSCLGSLLIAAGVDIADPEAPATNPQVGILHQLERDLGWTHDQGHAEAGVESYKELTREQAAELIDTWQAIKDARPESRYLPAPAGASPSGGAPPGERSEDPPGSTDPSADSGDPDQTQGEPKDDGPATAEQWKVATKHNLKSATVLRRARELFPDRGITSPAALTRGELAAAIEALL